MLLSAGLLSLAEQTFLKAHQTLPQDLRYAVNLANVYREQGEHHQALTLYQSLLQQLPDHPVIRRNYLTSLEYDLIVSDEQRLQAAKDWGKWAMTQAGGIKARPALKMLTNRPLRIGYVSADLCQHTVGWLVLPILQHHSEKVAIYTYHNGNQLDSITEQIKACSHFRHISHLSDVALVKQIQEDEIDVLIDLSGHTAGSRLSVFAHRPAPVQVSWLGYFASTGLETIDAVLLDDAHIGETTANYFTEQLIRLPSRWCYQPVPFAPEVASAPHLKNGDITFGSFNNTSKYNTTVFQTWASILQAVPNSRLLLKWRTYNDETLKQTTLQAFQKLGIDPHRIELRPASFHANLLAEYSDIDIALDPFPFTGGMTSLEALWMGVPIVTHPMQRLVSRQTHAVLTQVGLSECSATSLEDYIQKAVAFAKHSDRLLNLRNSLRPMMQASTLMDAKTITDKLELVLINLYQTYYEQQMKTNTQSKQVLHIGSGHRQNGARLPQGFQTTGWQEVRYDIDPNNEPDIVGDMLDMQAVASNSMDAIYSAHNIEHIYPYQVPQFLSECLRVLAEDGIAVITCPDLQTIAVHVANDNLADTLYNSPAGPITPLDVLYGHGAALAAGHHYMAHKTGFTLKTLTQALHTAGFTTSAGKRRQRGLDLWVVASKGPMDESALRELAGRVLPA